MNSPKKRCFVIGPMSDMKRLKKLALKVIKPIVSEHGFEVVTPKEGVADHFMHLVLFNFERTEIERFTRKYEAYHNHLSLF